MISLISYLERSIGSTKISKITWKLQTQIDWVSTWGILKKCRIPHAPCTSLSGTQFSTLSKCRTQWHRRIRQIKQHWSELRGNLLQISGGKVISEKHWKRQNYMKIADSSRPLEGNKTCLIQQGIPIWQTRDSIMHNWNYPQSISFSIMYYMVIVSTHIYDIFRLFSLFVSSKDNMKLGKAYERGSR
jgi:hypothetical protein